MIRAWLGQVFRDLGFAARALRRDRSYALVVLGTLTIAIGTTAVVFDLTSWIILRDAPYPHPEQLHLIGRAEKGVDISYYQPAWYLHAYREQTSSFSGFAAGTRAQNNVVLDGQPLPDSIEELSSDFLGLVGIQPMLGRVFRPEEYSSGRNDVVILSHHFWHKYLNSDPAALGRTLTIQGHACTIVGVFPLEPKFPPYFGADVYRPMEIKVDPKQPFSPYLCILARTKPGVTAAQARADLEHVSLNDLPAWAKRYFAGFRPALTHVAAISNAKPWWMMFAAGMLLYAIGCVNAMNLMLIRLFGRRRELSIRFAVGGSRAQVLQLMAIEGLLLAGIACALVAALSVWVFPHLFALINQSDAADPVSPFRPRTLLFTAALSIIASLVASAVPAIRLLRADITYGLKDGGPSLGESRRTGQIRTAFVIFQAAFAVILLTGTGLLVRSFDRLMHEDLGFDPTGKVKVWIGRPDRQNEKPEELLAVFERIQHQLGALPGVRGVSFGQDALLAGGGWKEDEMRMKDGTYQPVSFTLVGSDYPQTAGLTLRSGRWFSDRPKTNEVVVNDALAKQLFGTADPVGQMITLKNMGSDPRPVVGVVKDTKESASSAADARCFGAISLQPNRIGTLLLRLDRDPPPEFSDQVRRAAFAVDDRLFLSNLEPASQMVVNSRWAENYASRILKGLSAIALGLTIVGIFSVLAYTVDSRKSEFGVRLALGETPAGLNHLVMRRGLAAAATGVLVGLAGAAALTQLISGMLYRTSSYDPLVYASVSLVLLAAAALACWIPARRASRVDVVQLLKAS